VIRPRQQSQPRRLDEESARLLTLDAGTWLSCDECFDLVDQVAEDVVVRRTGLSPAFRDHLLGCPACREEAQTLVELVAEESRTSRTEALRRLEQALVP
jgi:hypothetical protein